MATGHTGMPDWDAIRVGGANADVPAVAKLNADLCREDDATLLRDELASANLGVEILTDLTKDTARRLGEVAAGLQQIAERLRTEA